ncbi:MAG: outer membrane beta-barrel protein [Candidatus Saccharicenans sp.]|nr:outer membrane beta-barrel protein [Candidatus Saccharicenans sp.]
MKWEEGNLAYQINLNGVYNFKTSTSFRPFLLAGPGINNGIRYGFVMEADDDLSGLALNAGGGLKYLIGNNAAFRFEYRYTHNRLKWELYYEKESFNHHQFLVGLSLFF